MGKDLKKDNAVMPLISEMGSIWVWMMTLGINTTSQRTKRAKKTKAKEGIMINDYESGILLSFWQYLLINSNIILSNAPISQNSYYILNLHC